MSFFVLKNPIKQKMKEGCSTHQVLVFLSFSFLAWNVLQTLYGPDRHGQARKKVCKESQTHQI